MYTRKKDKKLTIAKEYLTLKNTNGDLNFF
jgi:hypothetical protein